MTGAVIFLLSFAGYYLYISTATALSSASIPLFIVSSLAGLLYIFGSLGFLLPGAYALAASGFLLGIYVLYTRRGSFAVLLQRLREPAPVLFILIAFLLWLKLSGASYSAWDEFSHWGFAVKELFFTNAFPTRDSALYLKDYPPGTALFQYYIMLFTGWSEGNTYFAHALLLLSAALALLEGLAWKQWGKVLAVLSFALISVYVFGSGMQGLYVDHVLGLFFGVTIASYFLSAENGTRTALRSVPVLFILPLIKAVGLLLALIAAAVLITDQLLRLNVRGENFAAKKALPRLLLCALILAAPLISSRSWAWRVNEFGLKKTFNLEFSVSRIARSFSPDTADQRDKDTISEFKRVFSSSQVNPPFEGNTLNKLFRKIFKSGVPPLSTRNWLLIFALLSGAAIYLQPGRRERAQALSVFSWLPLGFAAYIFGLLAMYLYSFGSYEGTKAASFERYMGIYFLGWLCVFFGFLLRSGRGNARRSLYLLGAFMLGMVFISPKSPLKFILKRQKNPITALRQDVRALVQPLSGAIGPDKKVYVVWQNSTGLEPWVLAYELAPRITSTRSDPWSFGPPFYAGDVWTADWTPEKLGETLRNYDLVMVGKSDPAFRKRFSVLFTDGEKDRDKYLFVISEKGGRVALSGV